MSAPMHPLRVDGLVNVRDLGGHERADGTRTPVGVFLRSEVLDRVTPDGWQRLRDLGVATVVDLRRPEERSGTVPADVALVTVDLDGDEQDFWAPIEADGRWGTPLYYESHLETLPHRMRAVLDAIADAPEGAVLFHCGAGWDRTGFVAAMLMKAVDASPAAATADYLVSFETAEAFEALHGRSSHVEARLRILRENDHTPESAFRAAYDAIDLDAWFEAADVAPETRTAIRTWRGALN